MNTSLKIGSVCTGYGGLDAAVQAVYGGELVWVADNDKGAAKILAHRYPDILNLGDITEVDWTSVEPVDIFCAGFPCQSISYAGRGEGIKEGTQSGLWFTIARALGILRPRIVVLENVAAIVTKRPGLDVVLADLTRLGYDARWTRVRASDVGAPHQRNRWFCVAEAAHTCSSRRREESRSVCGDAPVTSRWAAEHDHFAISSRAQWYGPDAADATSQRHGDSRQESERGVSSPTLAGDPARAAASDAPGVGRNEGRPEPARQLGGSDAAQRGDVPPPNSESQRWEGARPESSRSRFERGSAPPTPDSADFGHERPGTTRNGGADLRTVIADAYGESGDQRRITTSGEAEGRGARSDAGGSDRVHVDWGVYEPAIRRWEQITGRPAPAPTEPGKTGQRLSPRFVEWMMGAPDGWVTNVPDLSRNAQLKALGNGVVTLQAIYALALLNQPEAA